MTCQLEYITAAGARQPHSASRQHVVVKISSEAFAEAAEQGTNPVCPPRWADEVASVHDLGVQLAVVVGRQLCPGTEAGNGGIGRPEADDIGMLGTVMSA
jgi:uridylate kinase